jgi:glycosyltransferase involved in cell wall biosynthesis
MNDSLTIIFIGRFVESKGVQMLYEIDRELQEKKINVDWKIIGSGNLEQFVREQWKNNKNVTFLAPFKNEDVLEVAKNCDLFVSPSVFEGYGIALLEAMSCSLVPIVYDLPNGISAILPHGAGFKITKGDIHGFADKIQVLDKDRGLLMEMKKNAHKFVANEYNIVETAKKYFNSFLSGESDLIQNRSNHKKLENIYTFGYFDKWFFPNEISIQLKKVRDWVRKNAIRISKIFLQTF